LAQPYGIIGALIIGDAAVSAGIVSPVLIIVVAITGIASFAIPDYSFGFHLRYFRFAFILLGFMAGFLGIALGLFVYISLFCSLRSFGVSYTTPFAPTGNSKDNGYLLPPIWKREYRPSYVASKRAKEQEKISMKWKYFKS
jgi:spore germination protein KA